MKLFGFLNKKNTIKEEKENYIKETDEYSLEINADIIDDETLEYANHIVDKYLKEKDKILNQSYIFYPKHGYKEYYLKKEL